MKSIIDISEEHFKFSIIEDSHSSIPENQYYLPVEISISVGAFSVQKSLGLELAELKMLYQNLDRVYLNLKSAAARLMNLDSEISILFEQNSKGQIQIEGEIIDGELYQNKLIFNTFINKETLSVIILDIKEYLNEK